VVTNKTSSPAGPGPHSTASTIAGVEHHRESVVGRPLHWVSAGSDGSPILLVHGFPETWWVFHRLIPLLASEHRVIAVDLPGFGDSGAEAGDYSSAAAAAALHALVVRLDLGPVHVSGQDVGGNTVFRLATQYPDDVRSLIAVETLVSGFGFERLADVAHRGAWHVGAIATPGVAEFVFAGRVREYLGRWWFPHMTRVAGAVTEEDIGEFARAYSRPGAWNGPHGLYASALRDGDELAALASAGGLRVPVLAVDGTSTSNTAVGMEAVSNRVTRVDIDGVGHHVALEAPERLAEAVLEFIREVEGSA
jgi:pimeloyl-ACP methyl ester carboxylesterase